VRRDRAAAASDAAAAVDAGPLELLPPNNLRVLLPRPGGGIGPGFCGRFSPIRPIVAGNSLKKFSAAPKLTALRVDSPRQV